MSNKSALDIYVHPLVIMNISDHYTRKKIQIDGNDENTRVIGAIFGTQEGKKVEIRTSFEVDFKIEKGEIKINEKYITSKDEIFKEIFPNYQILGWYSNGSQILKSDENIHKQFFIFNDNPLFLLMDTKVNVNIKDLPLKVYETMGDSEENFKFVKSKVIIETEESEKVSVDTVNDITASQQKNSSSLIPHFNTLGNALNMLLDRNKLVIEYLKQVESGKIKKINHKLLREISSICQRLPLSASSQQFSKEFTSDLNETLLVSYLATMTKGTHYLNELVDKYTTTFTQQKKKYASNYHQHSFY